MKKTNCTLFILAITLVINWSCERSKNNKLIIEDKILQILNLNLEGCKSTKKNNSNTEEKIIFKTCDKYYLNINHINAVFNCSPEEIITSAEIENGKIIINSCEKSIAANCTCQYDLDFKTGPLEYSEYTVIMNHCGSKITEFQILFNESTNESFTINKSQK